jgi:hypothetical protein
MKALLQEKNHAVSQRRPRVLFDGYYGVSRKENVIDMVAFDKKRSESPGKPSLLMTLTIFGISELQSMRDIIRGTVEELVVLSQEPYVKGWYRHAATFGVILTKKSDTNMKTLRDMIDRRLRTHLTDAQVDAIRISFDMYPDAGL